MPGFIGGSDSLSKAQLREVITSGLVEIGAHTMHHIALAYKLSSLVDYEVKQSKLTLEHEYNVSVSTFAYPGGSFDQQAVDIVKGSGFRLAVSTINGNEQSQVNRFFLYRIHPGNRIGNALIQYINDPKNYTTRSTNL